MTDLTSKYPQLAKIFDDQDKMFQYIIGDNTPVELKTVQNRAIDLIEQNVDRSDAEKEALAVGVVLMTAGPSIVGDPQEFAAGYSSNVNDFVTELTNASPFEAPSTNISQASTALSVVMLQDLAKGLREGALPAGAREQLTEAFTQSTAQEAVVFQNLNAPKLQAAYEAAKQGLASELGIGAAPANNNAPVPPKKKNNGGGSFDL